MTSGPAWIWYKFKYDDIYNQFIYGPKIALGLGPIESITYMSALNLLFAYIAYMLMVFSKQIRRELDNLNSIDAYI